MMRSAGVTTPASLPLPPGSTGLPILGEGFALAANPFGFVAERTAAHGAVARSRLMDKDLAILAGPEAAEAFLDEENVRRAGGLPPHAADLFGAGVVNQVDGEAHRRRKQHVMRALDHEALAAYLPDVRRRVRDRIAQLVAAGEVALQDRCIPLTVELISANFAGLSPDDATIAAWARGYDDFGRALFGVPIAFPGSPLARARRFTREMRATFAAAADARRLAPGADGATRLVQSEVDGERLSTEEIARELMHLCFAATGLWGWFCFGALALSNDRAMHDALRAEAATLPDAPDGRQLMEAPLLGAFVREVKRLGDVIPITALGVARRDFAVAGHRVPAGWLVTWTTLGSHRSPRVAPYADPERFDIGRYARGEGAAPHHFAPQGPGEALTSHRCGGVEYSTLVLLQFFTELLRAPRVQLLPQDLARDMSRLPARWKGGLRVRFGGTSR